MLLTYILNNVPTGELELLQMSGGTQVLPLWTRLVKAWSTHGYGNYFLCQSTPLHIRFISQRSIDCWHLVEGVGSENSFISRCNFNETLVENLPPPEKKQEVEFLRFLPANSYSRQKPLKFHFLFFLFFWGWQILGQNSPNLLWEAGGRLPETFDPS